MSLERPRIAIAGASGFVGSAVVSRLMAENHVIALTRSSSALASDGSNSQPLEWRTCDLFSLLDAERALEGVDYAVYLVHSMLPAAELTQGSFQDLDLLASDNFSRAAEKAGVKQIIYLGGIIPPAEGELSPHLASRMEVEEVLASHGVAVTTLRAAMVLGPGGSSMSIMLRLVKRLPVMICPSWTATRSQPIFLGDVVNSIEHVLGRPEHYGNTYDLGGPSRVSYRELMAETARQLGLPRKIYGVPFVTPRLSRLWVSMVTGSPKNLTSPLIESLRHEMIPDESKELQIPDKPFVPLDEALRLSIDGAIESQPRAFTLPDDEKQVRTVRSVQRLFLPKGLRAQDVADLYSRWLPKQMAPLLRVRSESSTVSFEVPLLPWPLLVLEHSEERSSVDRQLFYIRGGLLVSKEETTKDRGRLEFRETLDRSHIIAAIHGYHPLLPWHIYRYTQAKIHLWVMRSFDRFLQSKEVAEMQRGAP